MTVVPVDDCRVKVGGMRCLLDGVNVVVPIPLGVEDDFDEPLNNGVDVEFVFIFIVGVDFPLFTLTLRLPTFSFCLLGSVLITFGKLIALESFTLLFNESFT